MGTYTTVMTQDGVNSNIVHNYSSDGYHIVAGTNVTINQDDVNRELEISASGGDSWTVLNGLMSNTTTGYVFQYDITQAGTYEFRVRFKSYASASAYRTSLYVKAGSQTVDFGGYAIRMFSSTVATTGQSADISASGESSIAIDSAEVTTMRNAFCEGRIKVPTGGTAELSLRKLINLGTSVMFDVEYIITKIA